MVFPLTARVVPVVLVPARALIPVNPPAAPVVTVIDPGVDVLPITLFETIACPEFTPIAFIKVLLVYVVVIFIFLMVLPETVDVSDDPGNILIPEKV